jgi:DNA-binding MarR family transcriptional regulator
MEHDSSDNYSPSVKMTYNYARFFFWGPIVEFNLTPVEALFMVLVESLSHRDTNGCFASMGTLAEVLNVSSPTAYKARGTLIRKGLLEKGRKSLVQTKYLKPTDKWYSFIEEIKAHLGKEIHYP